MKYGYEVWALGYDSEDKCTNTTIFLGEFDTVVEATEHAKRFYDIECFTGKPDHPDYEELHLEEGEYLVVRVEQVVYNAEECCTEGVDVLWQNTVYQEELYEQGKTD